MPIFFSLLGNKWTWIAIVIAVMGLAVTVQTKRLDASQEREAVTRAQFGAFKAQVQAEGERAQKAAKKAEEAAILRAKESDDEAKKRYASLDAAYAGYRLRVRSGNGATERIVSASAPGAADGDRRCYSADALNRDITAALGRLRDGVADDTEPYDRAAEVARTARTWALKLDTTLK